MKANRWPSYNEARKIARALNLNSSSEWFDLMRSDKRLINLPVNPRIAYNIHWKGYRDFLGFNTKTDWLPFEEAKSLLHLLKMTSKEEWISYSKNSKPKNLPSNPQVIYSDNWKGYPDFLGYEG